MHTPLIIDNHKSGILTLTLNRTEANNALNAELIEKLLHQFSQTREDDAIRVLVLKANGKNFCAGADLNWMKETAHYEKHQNLAEAKQLAKMLHALYSYPKPVIALVQGAAFGGALGLVSAADIVIAEEQAKFCFSEVKLGLVPAVISPYVINCIGTRQAKKLFMTAERFDTALALNIGLIHHRCEASHLEDFAHKLIQNIVKNAPKAITEAKKLVNNFSTALINEAVSENTAALIANLRASEEGKEGISAFLEKRPPKWV